MDLSSVVTWVSENWGTVLGLLYMLLNLVSGVLDLAHVEHGFIGTLRSWLDRVSVLTARNAGGTVKLPLVTSKPKQ